MSGSGGLTGLIQSALNQVAGNLPIDDISHAKDCPNHGNDPISPVFSRELIQMFRCLHLLGLAPQEAVLAVAVVIVAHLQTQATSLPPPVASLVPPQVVNPPVLSRPAVHLRVRRMRELLPPGLIILVLDHMNSCLPRRTKITELLSFCS